MLCEKPIACNQCDFTAKTEVDLSTHMLFFHFDYKSVNDWCGLEESSQKRKIKSKAEEEEEYKLERKTAYEKFYQEKILAFKTFQEEKELAFKKYNKTLREQKKLFKKYGYPDGKRIWLCVHCGDLLFTDIMDNMPIIAQQHLRKHGFKSDWINKPI